MASLTSDEALSLELSHLKRMVKLAFDERNREDPLYGLLTHLYSRFERSFTIKNTHSLVLMPQLRLAASRDQSVGGERQTSLYRIPDFTSLLLADRGDDEIDRFLQSLYEVKSLDLPLKASPEVSVADWIGAPALALVGSIFKRSITQLMLQGILALYQYGGPVFVVFICGCMVAELKFAQPDKLVPLPEELMHSSAEFTATDADMSKELAPLLVKLLPYIDRPSCTVPLSPMFSKATDGSITGLGPGFLQILRREYLEIRRVSDLVDLNPLFIAIGRKEDGDGTANEGHGSLLTHIENRAKVEDDYISTWYSAYDKTVVAASLTPSPKKRRLQEFGSPPTPENYSPYTSEQDPDTESDSDTVIRPPRKGPKIQRRR
ncbi:hypothetical protein K435DRAFT_778728 [Dendrothele bispora CBS 962.96]|uniref:Uncharacterized protein n=1 Tax=Dendrothele bispora (strain CBS 962.96) TaxID=1314807 RepID=A0A4S8M298_DENBC|nr:hypothetical protein K435DRAFT_778728 [Dendrothele bispora CBS 962.96]